MKTLDQIAEAAGVTKAAIYKRFQNYGLSVNELKAEKQGRAKVYSDDIERLIILMFKPNEKVETLVEDVEKEIEEKTKEYKENIGRLEVEKKEAEKEKEKAEERAIIAESRAERAEAQTEILLRQIDKLTDAIRAAEAVQAAQITQMARIQAADVEKSKMGLLARFRERIKGIKKENKKTENERSETTIEVCEVKIDEEGRNANDE